MGGLIGGLLPALTAQITGSDTDAVIPSGVPLLVAALLLLPGIRAAMRTQQNRPAARRRSRIKPLLRISSSNPTTSVSCWPSRSCASFRWLVRPRSIHS